MSTLQAVALIVVAIGGTAVVFTPDALRQVMMLGIYGFALTLLFFVFQAPDVALSQIVVSAVGVPLILLTALRKIGRQERAQGDDEADQ